MINSEISVWDESITPVVRRNQPGHDIVIVDVTGKQIDDQVVKLIASDTAQARMLAEKLYQTAVGLIAMADAIDAEKLDAHRELASSETDRRARLAGRMEEGLAHALAQEGDA